MAEREYKLVTFGIPTRRGSVGEGEFLYRAQSNNDSQKEGVTPSAVIFDEAHSVTSSSVPESYADRLAKSVVGINGIEDLSCLISPGDSLTYGDVFFANRLLRSTSDLNQAISLIESGNVAAAEFLKWVRNDVVVAVEIVSQVSLLRRLIICNG